MDTRGQERRGFLLDVIDMQRLTLETLMDKISESGLPEDMKDSMMRCRASLKVLEAMALPCTAETLNEAYSMRRLCEDIENGYDEEDVSI